MTLHPLLAAATVISARQVDTNLPPIDPGQSLVDRFRLVASHYGDRPAVRDGSSEITYRKLDRESDRLASLILKRWGLAKQPVGLLFPQSAESVTSILSVLKSGNFYVSLDPHDDPRRLSEILRAAGCRLLLTDKRNAPLANEIASANLHLLDVADSDKIGDVLALPESNADDIAYIFFTSGTTGEPKGVVDSHRNASHNVLRYSETLHFGPGDRMSLVQAPSFSGTVSTLFGALLNGASLFPYDTNSRGLLAISSWLRSNEITIYHSVPSLFRLVFEDRDVSPALRLVRLEGDRATIADVRLFERTNSSAQIVNGLGTTETGLVTQFFVERGFDSRNGVLPVGYPVRDMEVSIVDETGAPVPNGVKGLVAVSSKYLAVGYRSRSKILQTNFHPNEDASRTYVTQDLGVIGENGLELHGRRGRRARLRGIWVEPAEVESAILSVEEVFDVVVNIGSNRHGDRRLEAFVVRNGQLTEKRLRSYLSQSLPPYMIPEKVAFVDRLPVTTSGKIDHDTLTVFGDRKSDRHSHSAEAPGEIENSVLGTISRIWIDELSSDTIGPDDNFFLLGGTSLTLARIHRRIEKAFDLRLPFEHLLGDLTIRHMSEVVARRQSDSPDPVGVFCLRYSSAPRPLFCIHTQTGRYLFYGSLAAWLETEVSVYAFGVDDPTLVVPPHNDFATIASRYVEIMRTIQPYGPYRLVGNCMGCLIAYEMAVQLQRAGEAVEALLLLDDTVPYAPYKGPGIPESLVQARQAARDGRLLERILFHSSRRLQDFRKRAARVFGRLTSVEERRRGQITRHLQQGRRTYAPPKYNGPATLVRGDVNPQSNEMHRLRWSDLATNVRCTTFSGHEDDMFHLPAVREVAQIVDSILAESTRRK